MAISNDIAPLLPFLRRFSRALNGSQARGDAYVTAALEGLLRDRSSFARRVPARIALYQFYLRVWSQPIRDDFVDAAEPSAFDRNLAALSPQVRQAFLLTTVEGFSEEDAAAIMGIDSAGLLGLLDAGARELAHELASSILIIEDEPIVAMDLESIVEDLGHRVVGVASARRQAVALAAERKPQLIMADIQLEDGGSGIEAVNEILADASRPVVFITAHPTAYLSALAHRPEPAFLLPKPFKPDSVRAAVSQALFFDRRARAAA
jgi:CheY-like chemotaxis protein